MLVIRILRRIAPRETNVDRARRLINVLHALHDPRALSDLSLHRSRRDVDEPQMIPSIALTHPQQLA